MKLNQKFVFLAGVLMPMAALAATEATQPSLEDQLESLNVPANVAPAGVTSEKLYAVQNRAFKLKGVHEISLGGAKNFTADSFVVSNQGNLTYRYHFSNRWSLGLSGSMVFNAYSSAGDRLLEMNGLLPDTAFVMYRGDLSVAMNAFYGKFRVSMDRVFYFDQYFTLGPGVVSMNTGTSPAAVAGAGFVFWYDRNASIRVGVKDQIYQVKRTLSTGITNDVLGFIDIGILLGGDRT